MASNHYIPGILLVLVWFLVWPGDLYARLINSTDCCHARHLRVIRHDTGRFPVLLDVGDTVDLVSWVAVEGNGSQMSLSGNLVLPRDTLNRLRRNLPDSLRSVAHHEYVLPRPTKWWSWHFQQSEVDSQTVQTVKRIFDSIEGTTTRTKTPDHISSFQLKGHFPERGHRLGEYFLVTAGETSSLSPGSDADFSTSSVVFQSHGDRLIVFGDITVPADQIGPVIRFLYRHDLHFLSLAYKSLRRERRLYFVHFAGAGSPGKLISAVQKLLKKHL